MAKFIAAICLILALVGLSLAQQRCPNGCNSPNGYCLSTGVCQCVTGYRGVDCSISDSALTFPASVENQVMQGNWRYYHYTVPAHTEQRLIMTVVVPPSTTNADADMYVKKGTTLPTRTSYDWAHTGTTRESILAIPATNAAQSYYIGIYGYTSVAKFTLQVTRAHTACPGDCTGHGRCNENTGVCDCDTGYFGHSCNGTAHHAPLGSVTENLPLRAWKYYYALPPHGATHMLIDVTQSGTTGDVDLYVKRGSVPTFSNFDFADSGVLRHFNITVPNPTANVPYYFGFYAFQATAFRWEVSFSSPTNECPNQCSGPTHGTCTSRMCHCANGFSGSNCGQMSRDLMTNPVETVDGHVDANEWNYYSVSTFSALPLTVRVQHGAGQDCDVYVQRDRNPTRFDFLYRDITYSLDTKVTVSNPMNANWKIGVLGYSRCDYNISTYFNEPQTPQGVCLPQCTQNGGTCVGSTGACQCPASKAGEYCQYPIQSISNGQTLEGTVGPNGWVYFRYQGSTSALSVVVHEDVGPGRAGVLWLYSSVAQSPTLTNYDFSDTHTGTVTHRINIEVGQYRSSNFYIGVYASPFAINPTNPFKITVWAAPFK